MSQSDISPRVYNPVNMMPPDSERLNRFQSAHAMMEALKAQFVQLTKGFTRETAPVMLALLNSGTEMVVDEVASVGFSTLRITGRVAGSTVARDAVVFTHMASVQLMFVAREQAPPTPQKRPMGFMIYSDNPPAPRLPTPEGSTDSE